MLQEICAYRALTVWCLLYAYLAYSRITLCGSLWTPIGLYLVSSLKQTISIIDTGGSSVYPNFEGPPRAKPRSEVHLGDAVIAIMVTRKPNRYSGTPMASPLRASRTVMRSGTVANTLLSINIVPSKTIKAAHFPAPGSFRHFCIQIFVFEGDTQVCIGCCS